MIFWTATDYAGANPPHASSVSDSFVDGRGRLAWRSLHGSRRSKTRSEWPEEAERHDAEPSPARPAKACARIGARDHRAMCGRSRPQRAVPMGQRQGVERGRFLRDDHSEAIWRPRPRLSRSRSRCRRGLASLRRQRADRGRGQHGRHLRRHALRQRGAEEARGRAGALRRQARHLHHRARRGIGRQRDDHARRPQGQRLRHQRRKALDHRRRGIAAASGVRPRVRRGRRGARHRRLSGDPRQDKRTC